jgi:hypothetical protein
MSDSSRTSTIPPPSPSPSASTSPTRATSLTTWFDGAPEALDNGAATGKVLCAPSRGTGFSASLFDAHCGSGGAHAGETGVCGGDTLRTRFSLANYSTHDVDFDVRLWLSADDTWDWHDIISPTRPAELHLDAAQASRHGMSFEVPPAPSGTRQRGGLGLDPAAWDRGRLLTETAGRPAPAARQPLGRTAIVTRETAHRRPSSSR